MRLNFGVEGGLRLFFFYANYNGCHMVTDLQKNVYIKKTTNTNNIIILISQQTKMKKKSQLRPSFSLSRAVIYMYFYSIIKDGQQLHG